MLRGSVESVSRDALQTGNRNDGAGRAKTAGASDDQDGQDGPHESAYVARIALAATAIDTEDGPLPLEPGMAVTAEIKTGQRRVINYVLSPLLRYRHEGLRER